MRNLTGLKILLAVLQLAHYDAGLFRTWLGRHKTPREWAEFKAQTVSTAKARALFWFALPLAFFWPKAAPRALLFAAALLKPIEGLLITRLSFRARRHLRRSRPKIAIGITGSYGKTTAKEIIAAVLAQKFRVHKTPENINTLLGVARWLMAKSFEREDVLIVEMGAYRRGDIAKLCRLVRPDIGILTGVNEAHLERFGTVENTKAAKCELFDALPSGSGKAFWNKDSKIAAEAAAEREGEWIRRGLTIIPYGAGGTAEISLAVLAKGETALNIAVKHNKKGWAIDAIVPLLGEHHALPIAAAIAVASGLGLNAEEIRRGLEAIRPLERRLAPTRGPEGRLVIDDSYNITLEGVAAAFSALKKISRRKVGVFAGIPEAGAKKAEVNRALGRMIAETFDVLLLRRTPVSEYVISGLSEAGRDKAKLIWYTRSEEVENLLASILKPQDCTYFSAYDWPAVYL